MFYSSCSAVFKESATSLDQWLPRDHHTSPEVVYTFRTYLLGRVAKTITSILRPGLHLHLTIAEYHNRLGWDNFLEQRICAFWFELRARDLAERNLERNVDYWARGLMCRLLKMVHQQFLYPDATVLVKLKDVMTASHQKAYLVG
jgi:hypothetical protein